MGVNEGKAYMSIKSYAKEFVKHAMLLGAICTLVYLGQAFSCARIETGFTSMRPHIDSESLVLMDCRPARAGELSTEDIICYTWRTSSKTSTRAGRVVALPGEVVSINKGVLMKDGHIRQTASSRSIASLDFPPIMVPAGHVLVLFDQPSGHLTLRGQLIPFTEIRGVVVR